MPLKHNLNELEAATEIVDVPAIKVSKYDFLTRKIDEADGKCVKISREALSVGASKDVIDGFIRNIQSHTRRQKGFETNGMSQNGTLYFWKRSDA